MSVHDEKTPGQPHRARLEALGTLASGIAHEINTPIQFVGDNLQFISDSFGSIDQILARYAALHEAVSAIEGLKDQSQAVADALEEAEIDFLREELPSAIEQSLNGIQQVARIASAMKVFAHKGSTEKEMADLNQAIELTVSMCRNEWKYDADLEMNLDPHLPKIRCLPGELCQVWLNLIVNAAHAVKAKPDLERGLIKIATEAAESRVTIVISDNGTGIDPALHEEIFEPFFSTKEAGEGSGQGLAITRRIVTEQHGGWIDVWSEVGVGTRFTLSLPINSEISLPTADVRPALADLDQTAPAPIS